MRRILILALLLGSLAFPGAVLGFHHGDLPSSDCAATAAGSPSNDNGNAKEALVEHHPEGPPLAPVGVPGEGPSSSKADEHCANN